MNLKIANKPRRRILAVAVIISLLCVGTWACAQLWQRICGNYSIHFYGRVVDGTGAGMADVVIRVQLVYSGRVSLPVAFSGSERVRTFEVRTREDGCFEVGPVNG